jgi:pimeloyl-ACP methyl ester carboxylesterase
VGEYALAGRLPCGQDETVSESFTVKLDGAELHGERWAGDGPVLVLLHEGVADLRGWRETAELLSASAEVIAYDRRGYGRTGPSQAPYTHADDLLAVLDRFSDGPVWLVGASAGGGLALDTALLAPERVAGLVLIAPAVSGAPEPELDPDTQALSDRLDAAYEADDAAMINRLETWLWLDGPAQPEGRVSGPARDLALDMNATVIGHGEDEETGGSDTGAWDRLGEIRVPVIVACGDLDVPFLVSRSLELATRLPNGCHEVLPGFAHQPYLEDPALVAEVITGAMAAGRPLA